MSCIGIPVNLTEVASLLCIEPACRNIDILRFNLELPASAAARPFCSMPEKLCSYATAPAIRMNTNIPEYGKVSLRPTSMLTPGV